MSRPTSLRLPISRLILGLLAVACGAPTPSASHLRVESEKGAITAEVDFDGGVARGDNTVNVQLTAEAGRAAPQLLVVDAAMLAHDHHATAKAVVLEGDTYRVTGLDLFMSGRWLVALELSQGEEADRASFAIDVP
jgi:hypothetical protein